MPIVSSSATIKKYDDRFRVYLEYDFTDGTVIKPGHSFVDSQAEADALLAAMESDVLASKKNRDAEDSAEADGDIEASGDATQEHVAGRHALTS